MHLALFVVLATNQRGQDYFLIAAVLFAFGWATAWAQGRFQPQSELSEEVTRLAYAQQPYSTLSLKLSE
jgi:hypothetical protein